MADMMTDCHALPPEIIEVARRGAKASLECFARMFWPVVNPGVDMVWNWHLKAQGCTTEYQITEVCTSSKLEK